MTDNFENDHKYVSTKWLISLVVAQGLPITHLLRVTHLSPETPSTHTIALLEHGLYVCDCCMGANLGIPCRHFFNAMTNIRSLPFHIGLIRTRCVHIRPTFH